MNTSASAHSDIENLASSALTERLMELMTRERHCRAEMLIYLAEFDRRKVHLELGYRSLFTFCADCLGMSSGSAYRRTAAARLITRFPVIIEYLRDGRLSLTALCELRDVLTEENHRDLLERATHLNEDEIKLLVATLNPKPDLAESIRRVPVRTVLVPRPLDGRLVADNPALDLCRDTISASSPEPGKPSTPDAAAQPPHAVNVVAVMLPPKPATLKPLSAERFALRLTVSKEFVDQLRQLKDALSHVVPSGKTEDVLEECMRIASQVCDRRLRGSRDTRRTSRREPLPSPAPTSSLEPLPSPAPTSSLEPLPSPASTSSLEPLPSPAPTSSLEPLSSPAPTSSLEPLPSPAPTSSLEPLPSPAPTSSLEPLPSQAPTSSLEPRVDPIDPQSFAVEVDSLPSPEPRSRYVPVEVRRQVFQRDEGCCAFVGPDGRRCRSTYQVQFHHKVTHARGGPPTAENLMLMCAQHNRYQASLDYGAAFMDRFTRGPRGPDAATSSRGKGVAAGTALVGGSAPNVQR